MEWLYSLFLEHSALQAVVVLSLISAIGLGLGRVHFWGVSLGVTFVFFAGILAGHLGLSVDPQMLNYAESFGLVIFVYSLGLQVGPGFFSSFRKGGVTLNMLALGVVLLGTLLTVVASYATGVSLPDMVGILCGATTKLRHWELRKQTLKQMGMEQQYSCFRMCGSLSDGGSWCNPCRFINSQSVGSQRRLGDKKRKTMRTKLILQRFKYTILLFSIKVSRI